MMSPVMSDRFVRLCGFEAKKIGDFRPISRCFAGQTYRGASGGLILPVLRWGGSKTRRIPTCFIGNRIRGSECYNVFHDNKGVWQQCGLGLSSPVTMCEEWVRNACPTSFSER
jgi:hypothetical protein